MNETLRLGTIAGIRVGVNWSVLAIFVLLLLGLSAGRFPLEYPGNSPWAYAVAGAIAGIVFLLSLLAHELAHSVVAQREGIEVEGITLWLLGGVAKFSGDAPTPAADLRIAAVGPLVSLALGAGFGALALVARLAGLEGLTLGAVSWLALINVVLAVFNLVPAAPLDGGRILRALLWRRHGDRVRAAVSAARAGRNFGWGLIAVGIISAMLVPGLGGLWFALLGWFIASAAGMEEQYAKMQNALEGMVVREVMSPEPLTVPAGLTVAELLERYVLRHRFSSYPVIDPDGSPRGLVTLQRIRELPPERRATTPVEQIATPLADTARAHPTDSVIDVFQLLSRAPDGRVLVIDQGRVVGIVSATDLARMLEITDLRRQWNASPSTPSAPGVER